MGDQQARPLESGQVVLEQPAQPGPRADVEGGEGLVQQQHGGVGYQCPGQSHALPLASGKATGAVAGHRTEAHRLQPSGGAPAGLPAGYPAGAKPEGHVLQRAQMGEQRAVLEYDADPALCRSCKDPGVRVLENPITEPYVAPVEPNQAGQRPHRRGLARPVRAQQGHRLPEIDAQSHVQMEAGPFDYQARVEAGSHPLRHQ